MGAWLSPFSAARSAGRTVDSSRSALLRGEAGVEAIGSELQEQVDVVGTCGPGEDEPGSVSETYHASCSFCNAGATF